MNAVPSSDAELRSSQAEKLREMYDVGASVSDLVARTGLSHGTVLNRLRLAGTVMRAPAETRRLREARVRRRLGTRLKRQYEAGVRVEVLAADLDISVYSVRRALAEVGVAFRTTPETRRIPGDAGAGGAVPGPRNETLRSRYETRVKVSCLAAEMGVSTSTVYRLLHRAGTTMFPAGRSHGRGGAQM